jgi:hypothetical protein
MNELRPIRAKDIYTYLEPDVADLIWPYAQLSDPIFVGLYRGEYVCMVGFIPKTLLADEAFVWLQDGPAVQKHKLLVGLYAKRLIKIALQRYPKLFGFCGTHSTKWLLSLGADITFPRWVIEAKHE